MKFRFKIQPYQTNAVQSVLDCFVGQPKADGSSYRFHLDHNGPSREPSNAPFANSSIALSDAQMLENVQAVQRRQNLPLTQALTDFTALNARGERVAASAAYKRSALSAARVHLDVEMETGTGKTYCYVKTMFEMNNRYGWSKFVVMVPSIAIREGVYKTLKITADHFAESYGKRARYFVYNSRRMHELESFSSDSGIYVMIINVQAFNARGAENRRIYDELDDFQSRKPIDVLASSQPILILDEPQRMEGAATMRSLPKFNPAFILRYSATHRTQHNSIYRLDALDAYNAKLVKRISVTGIETRGITGTAGYLYLEAIQLSKRGPVARIEMETRQTSGEVKRRVRLLRASDSLFVESGELEQYRGFTVSQIDYVEDVVEFTNGILLRAGEPRGDVSEGNVRRIQIRETIRAHLEKERQLFSQGVKVLSLFFVDEVVKYRDYQRPDQTGEYGRVFEEEYEVLRDEVLSKLEREEEPYRRYLATIETATTHNGYFSIDRRTSRLKDPTTRGRSVESDDVDAYDLILKDKERLLSFAEPTRFIFSHSALREGWDNPNVFVMCMLKRSDNTISRRQEVGRGLRLSVDQRGERMDLPAVVHDINVLKVVASESYKDFVAGLQQEVTETLSARPRLATEAYFTDKVLGSEQGKVTVTPAMAKQIYRYLVKNDYTDDSDRVAEAYHQAKAAGELAELPETLKPYTNQVFELVDSVFSDVQLPKVEDGRRPKTNPLNANFEKKEFQELWTRINRKAVYRVDFDSDELIRTCIDALNHQLRVMPLRYTVRVGLQHEELTDTQLRAGEGFTLMETSAQYGDSVHSIVKYDLIGKVAERAALTRSTTAAILTQIEATAFDQFKSNPEHFISSAAFIIAEQKAAMVIERLSYDELGERYDGEIFTANQAGQDFSRATAKLRNHVYDYAITDSCVERTFVTELDASNGVVVYAKLPRGFLIPTPVGDYNPDWAISFKAGCVKHIYFVAETKGSMSSMKLREIEKTKIECARKFFDEINHRISQNRVKYDVVTDYGTLMDVVGRPR